MITTRENGPNGATITQHGHPIYLCYDEAPKVATDLVDLLLEHRAQESREYLLTLANHIENWYMVADIDTKCTGTFGKSGPECDKCSRYEDDCDGQGEFK